MDINYECESCKVIGELDEYYEFLDCPECGGVMHPLSTLEELTADDFVPPDFAEDATISIPRDFIPKNHEGIKVASAVDVGFGGMLSAGSGTGAFSPVTAQSQPIASVNRTSTTGHKVAEAVGAAVHVSAQPNAPMSQPPPPPPPQPKPPVEDESEHIGVSSIQSLNTPKKKKKISKGKKSFSIKKKGEKVKKRAPESVIAKEPEMVEESVPVAAPMPHQTQSVMPSINKDPTESLDIDQDASQTQSAMPIQHAIHESDYVSQELESAAVDQAAKFAALQAELDQERKARMEAEEVATKERARMAELAQKEEDERVKRAQELAEQEAQEKLKRDHEEAERIIRAKIEAERVAKEKLLKEVEERIRKEEAEKEAAEKVKEAERVAKEKLLKEAEEKRKKEEAEKDAAEKVKEAERVAKEILSKETEEKRKKEDSEKEKSNEESNKTPSIKVKEDDKNEKSNEVDSIKDKDNDKNEKSDKIDSTKDKEKSDKIDSINKKDDEKDKNIDKVEATKEKKEDKSKEESDKIDSTKDKEKSSISDNGDKKSLGKKKKSLSGKMAKGKGLLPPPKGMGGIKKKKSGKTGTMAAAKKRANGATTGSLQKNGSASSNLIKNSSSEEELHPELLAIHKAKKKQVHMIVGVSVVLACIVIILGMKAILPLIMGKSKPPVKTTTVKKVKKASKKAAVIRKPQAVKASSSLFNEFIKVKKQVKLMPQMNANDIEAKINFWQEFVDKNEADHGDDKYLKQAQELIKTLNELKTMY